MVGMIVFVGFETLAIIMGLTVVTILRRLKTHEQIKQRIDQRYGIWQEKRWVRSTIQQREENRKVNGDPYSDMKSERM